MSIDVSIFPINGVKHFLKGLGLESSQKTQPTPLSPHTHNDSGFQLTKQCITKYMVVP